MNSTGSTPHPLNRTTEHETSTLGEHADLHADSDSLDNVFPGPLIRQREADDLFHAMTSKIALEVEAQDGEVFTIEIVRFPAWAIVETIRELGVRRAVHLVQFATEPVWGIATEQPNYPPGKNEARLYAIFNHFFEQAEREQWKTPTDELLSWSYHLLRERKITRTAAAAFASMRLNKHINPDTWRKRVDRWASARGLPKVEQRRS